MSNEELSFESFKDIVSEILGVDANEINKDLDIYDEFRIDSLALVSFGKKIEEKLNIELYAADMVSLRTVGEFYESVDKVLKENK